MRFSEFHSTIARMVSAQIVEIDVFAISRPSWSTDAPEPCNPIRPFLGSEKLIQEGAAGYLEKGSLIPEKLENAISGILKKRLLVAGESDVTEP